jgi:peptidoglycan/LPS O-acetylase OafA/YrhL
VEEHFYLIWPLVLGAAGAVGGWRMAWSCVGVCWFLRCVVSLVLPAVMSPADASYYSALAENSTLTRLDTISMGCLLALACRSDYWRGWLDALTRPPLLVLYAVTILASLELGASAKFHLCVFYTVSGFCIALLVWGVVRNEGFVQRCLENPVLSAIGVGSYSIYLWQQLFIHPTHPRWIHAFPQNIVLALCAAYLSYRFVETPMNRLKDRVTA